jgi:cellulose synthase/poly-beta-1,6-N-acetylglucosamine synthase-like glycosyltransferase
MSVIAVLCATVLLWTYGLYPWLMSRRVRRSPAPTTPRTLGEEPPSVALIIAARDEGPSIAARVENALALTYPRLTVIVVSDGSTDDTVAQARAASGGRVIVLGLNPSVGKTRALEVGVTVAGDVDVLAFSDATAVWAPDTVQRLVLPLLDPAVGAVSGKVVYDYPNAPIARGFRAYQAVIVAQRANDAAWGTLTSVSGSISAIRRTAYFAAPAELSTDLVFPWAAARAGLRAVYAHDAISLERSRDRASRELKSRVRLALSAYAFTAWVLRHRKETPRSYAFQLLSHKVLRWCSPHVALIGAIAAGIAWPALALPVALGAVAAVSAALLGLLVPVLAPVTFAAVVALGYVWGSVLYVFGARPVGWRPDSQR